VFCDRCRIKSSKELRVKVEVVIQVKKEKKKKKAAAQTAALDGTEGLNKA
jgi:hypothetical protein